MQNIKRITTQTAWWAAAAVLYLHQLVQILDLRSQTDSLTHFLGGLAITAFIWTLCPLFTYLLGPLFFSWRIIVTFGGGCSAALIWELAEFASDQFLNTSIQHTIEETMTDLVAGFAGCCLACLAVATRYKKD